MKKFLQLFSSLIIFTSLLTFPVSEILAVPAFPKPIMVEQPDGSKIELRLIGDEYGHITLDSDGNPMMTDSRGFWVRTPEAAETAIGRLHYRRARKIRKKGQRAQTHSFPTKGEVRSIVILVEFSDIRFVTQQGVAEEVKREFNEMLNLPGFDRREHIGSAADYFRTQSQGQFSPRFDVYGPVRADRPAAYYGANDENGDDMRAHELAMEICTKLDNEIDFSQYDLNNDGKIDNVYFFYAGFGENFAGNKADWIWPHAAFIDDLGIDPADRTFDGKILNSYGCCAELYGSSGTDTAAIGTFCHEYGHILGLPDTYDVNYSIDGSGNHPDKWDIMASGSYLPETRNCGAVPAGYTGMERWQLGWADPIEIALPQYVTLPPLQQSARFLRISTDNPDEFFILENRQQTAGSYDRFLPYHGMLIWHVDRRPDAQINATFGNQNLSISCADAWSLDYNAVNVNAAHQCLEIEKASGNSGTKSTADTPFPGRQMITTFNDETSPSMRSWTGKATAKPVTDIIERDGNIYFSFMGALQKNLKITACDPEDITENSFTAVWNPLDEASLGYEIELSEVSREHLKDVTTINETLSKLPEGWETTGSAEFKQNSLTLGGTQASALLLPAIAIPDGATLNIRARQENSANSAALTIKCGDTEVDSYVPTITTSGYTVTIPATAESMVISLNTARRKPVVIEQLSLVQDVEKIVMTPLPDKKAQTAEGVTRFRFEGLQPSKEYAFTAMAKGLASSVSEPRFITTASGSEGPATGIEEIESDSDSVITEYFTVDGFRLSGVPSHGIYIMRRGKEVRKIIVKD